MSATAESLMVRAFFVAYFALCVDIVNALPAAEHFEIMDLLSRNIGSVRLVHGADHTSVSMWYDHPDGRPPLLLGTRRDAGEPPRLRLVTQEDPC